MSEVGIFKSNQSLNISSNQERKLIRAIFFGVYTFTQHLLYDGDKQHKDFNATIYTHFDRKKKHFTQAENIIVLTQK